jgi:hypothetical protein
MKISCIVVTVLASAPLWAGLRIKSDQTDMKTGKVTQDEILLDAERLRINQGGGRAMLFLTDGGRDRVVILNESRNEYQEIDKQTMNQLSQQMSGVMAQLQERMKNMPPEQRAQMEKMLAGRMGQAGATPAAPRSTYVAKGSGSINGFSCTRYEEMEGAEKVADICSAKPSDLHFNPADFQVFEKMKDFASGLLSANVPNSPFKNNYLMTPGIDGYPIERINYVSGQAVTKDQLKSIDRSNFSDADFSLGDARKVDLFAGRGGRQ